MAVKLKKVLIMAGGTGGHVFPGLSVAKYFMQQGIEVHWLGTQAGLEATIVPKENIPFHTVNIAGLRGKGLASAFNAPVKISKAIFESIKCIKSINPDLVVGMGGFVSGPGGFASWVLGRPLIIHEQNAKAGLTNKILARFAHEVLQGFPEAFKSKHAITIGNPVRAEIEALAGPIQRAINNGPLKLLVVGGSLGAKAINSLVPAAIANIAHNKRPLVIHQTGQRNYDEAVAFYKMYQVEAKIEPFIDDMASVYAWADIVICRAGALTVAELCAAGLPAIFVPYPYAVDDHQTANANYMVKKQAAICIQQRDLTADGLVDMINTYTNLPEKRMEMAKAAYSLRQVSVAEKIYAICEEICS